MDELDIHLIARTHDLKKLKVLLEKNPCLVNLQDSSGKTALIIISEALGDHVEFANYLLECGADPHIKDDDGWTAIDWANLLTNVDIDALLLSKNASYSSLEK